MTMSAEAAAQQIQERLKQISRLIHQIEHDRRQSDVSVSNIEQSWQHAAPATKLKTLYKACLDDATQEEHSIRQALGKINEIRNIRNERRIQARLAGNKEIIRRGALIKMVQLAGQTLPLHVSANPDEKPPPLCGAIPAESNYVAKVGDFVAALDNDDWILGEVAEYQPRHGKYHIFDIDEEQRDRLTLSKRMVIPCPLMRANPETDESALFPKDTMVMALYPQTTCFYKAIVHSLPRHAHDDYRVLFEDYSFAGGYANPMPVAQRYVIAYRPPRKNGGGGGGGSVFGGSGYGSSASNA